MTDWKLISVSMFNGRRGRGAGTARRSASPEEPTSVTSSSPRSWNAARSSIHPTAAAKRFTVSSHGPPTKTSRTLSSSSKAKSFCDVPKASLLALFPEATFSRLSSTRGTQSSTFAASPAKGNTWNVDPMHRRRSARGKSAAACASAPNGMPSLNSTMFGFTVAPGFVQRRQRGTVKSSGVDVTGSLDGVRSASFTSWSGARLPHLLHFASAIVPWNCTRRDGSRPAASSMQSTFCVYTRSSTPRCSSSRRKLCVHVGSYDASGDPAAAVLSLALLSFASGRFFMILLTM
mmetsp:Transcript_36803/g.113559  ORF Transcript_36803/g.113559 Transcript_36803/m.113559 type:complete len:290 (-) Transcript_36803:394-1263(-)